MCSQRSGNKLKFVYSKLTQNLIYITSLCDKQDLNMSVSYNVLPISLIAVPKSFISNSMLNYILSFSIFFSLLTCYKHVINIKKKINATTGSKSFIIYTTVILTSAVSVFDHELIKYQISLSRWLVQTI